MAVSEYFVGAPTTPGSLGANHCSKALSSSIFYIQIVEPTKAASARAIILHQGMLQGVLQ